MAQVRSHHLAVIAGLSGGGLLLAPQAAYALALPADVPLDGLEALVASPVVPFAAGAVVGAVVTGVVAAAEKRSAASSGKARGAVRDDDPTLVEGRRARRSARRAEREAERAEKRRPRFHRHDPAEGAPVIARAGDALAEQEAWEEIDAYMRETPFNCDPAKSHDSYELAFAELAQRTNATGIFTLRPDLTGAAARTAGAVAVAQPQAKAAPVAGPAQTPEEIEAERKADADAALRTLDVLGDLGEEAPKAVAPLPIRAGAYPAAKSAAASRSAIAPAGTSTGAAKSAPITFDENGMVTMADYSGHEEMWAAALAVLAEDAPAGATGRIPAASLTDSAASALGSTGVFLAAAQLAKGAQQQGGTATTGVIGVAGVPSQPVVLVPAYAVPVSSLGAQQPARAAAPASRVDEIYREELAFIDQQRRNGVPHPHLSVVNGRTEAMPRLKAQQGVAFAAS